MEDKNNIQNNGRRPLKEGYNPPPRGPIPEPPPLPPAVSHQPPPERPSPKPPQPPPRM